MLVFYVNKMFPVGAENYDTFKEYGMSTFKELHDIDKNGIVINGVHHHIKVLSTSDWKACSVIEGIMKFFSHIAYVLTFTTFVCTTMVLSL